MSSPRKMVPLAGGDERRSRTGVTKRIFFCGVVVENSDNGKRLPQDVREMVLSLGESLEASSHRGLLASSSESSLDSNLGADRMGRSTRSASEAAALADVINELVATERSYVKRLRTLKHDYADPLRQFSRSKDTAILPAYEAKTLFGNIDNLLPVNEAFLVDLEKMVSSKGTIGVGDVALKHFKEMRGFETYKQYYIGREEAQSIFEREMARKSSGFAAYIDRIKYSSADTRNRVGLRELLMDPVQRIPRYTLLFRTMIKLMSPEDAQRHALVEADEIASKIALAETDEQTKRAATMYSLSSTIEGFPPGLISNSRQLIDYIDVVDVPVDALDSSASSTASLHCTLFLFDDKLLITKRPGNGEKSGRVLTGLDDLDKVTKAGGLPKKSGLSCKGVLEITDIVATDVGGAEIHFYFENPPLGQTDRWSGRPFRSYAIVHPPSPIYLDPTRTEADKKRFLESLWRAQAMYRTRSGQSVALRADECEVEAKGGCITWARTYYNLYQRTAFLKESRKTKVVVHIDPTGLADPLPLGFDSPPFVVIRIQPMPGELSRYSVTSSDPSDESEEDIVQTPRVPGRIVQTIHQYGLFKFHTGKNSAPSTPSASRSRATVFGLDAISRKLFSSSKTGSSRSGDFFTGSLSSMHHRSKSSTISQSSTYTQSMDGSLMKFSSRSNSTATRATTVSTASQSLPGSRSSSRSRLQRRSKSPAGSGSEADGMSVGQSLARSRSRSRDRSSDVEYSDPDDDGTIMQHMHYMDESELDLTKRLELARRNSQNQHGNVVSKLNIERPNEETIHEEGASFYDRPSSRASKTPTISRPVTPIQLSDTPTGGSGYSENRCRPTSRNSDRRPGGPRTPSPMPLKSLDKVLAPLPSTDVDLAVDPLNESSCIITHPTEDGPVSPLPRSRRLPFVPTEITNVTPKSSAPGSSHPPSSVEPLSIKKKTSVRSSPNGASGLPRKIYTRNSPLMKTPKPSSPRRVSPQVRSARPVASAVVRKEKKGQEERLEYLCQTTKEDIAASQRAVKKIKLDIQELETAECRDVGISRPSSPQKAGMRTQRGNAPLNKAAQERMEEMRQLLQKRQEENPFLVGRHESTSEIQELRMSDSAKKVVPRSLQENLSGLDQDLSRATSDCETLQTELKSAVIDWRQRAADLERARTDVQNSRRQLELVKSLLADATAEKEIMYEAFNEELDGMYNDMNLPEDEAWQALTKDLRHCKETRNGLSRENSKLKRRIAEVETQNEEWGAILRAHGLIPP